MGAELHRGFRVGEYDIRPLEGRIIGPNGAQHVQPKVMEVLVCLAENAGNLVERDAIIQRGWGGTNVSADVLTRCISELRHHLDDHHDAVRYVQTIPKRGYRLVAEVEPFDGEVHTDPAVSLQPPSASSQRNSVLGFWTDLKRRNVVRVSIAYAVVAWLLMQIGETVFGALQLPAWTLTLLLALIALGFPIAVILAWAFQVTPDGIVLDVPRQPSTDNSLRRNLDIVIIGALLVAVGVLGYRAFYSDISSNDRIEIERYSVRQPENSIAVLRFLPIGGEPYFADGLCEELLDRFANLKEIGVAARTSSWAFSDKDVDIPTIADQLEVDYVLEGSVRQSGDQIRVTAQLNDGDSGKHLWSQTYDRQLTTENFFATQTEIASEVVDVLQLSLSPQSQVRLENKPETNLHALQLYLRGQEYLRMPHTDESLRTAAEFFSQALEVDNRFAMAYAGLCQAELGNYIISRDVAHFESGERSCNRALTLDNDMPRVIAALGTLHLFSGQYEVAEVELRKAIGESPNLIDAYADLGETLEYLGRMDEAEQMFRDMTIRQPGYYYAHNALGSFLYRQSRFEEAAEAYTAVTQLVPDRALGYNNVANAHYMLGDFANASQAYELSVQVEPYVDNYSNLGLTYYYEGRYDEAAAMQLKASELRPDDARVLGRLATAYHFGGRVEEATPIFRNAIELLGEQLAINPDDIRINRYLAVYNGTIGNMDEAKNAIQHVLTIQPDSSGVQFDAAKIALAIGDTSTALEHLENARDLGYSINIIRSDPAFITIRDEDKFKLIAE